MTLRVKKKKLDVILYVKGKVWLPLPALTNMYHMTIFKLERELIQVLMAAFLWKTKLDHLLQSAYSSLSVLHHAFKSKFSEF